MSNTATIWGVGQFSPASIPNLLYWYDAGDLALSDGDPVSTLVDNLSGSSRNATQSGAARPIYHNVSGVKYVNFDGSSQYFNLPDLTGLGLTEIQAVIKGKLDADPPASATTGGMWQFGTTGSAVGHWPFTSDGTIYSSFATDTRKTTTFNTGGSMASNFFYSEYSKASDFGLYLNSSTAGYTTATNNLSITTGNTLGLAQDSFANLNYFKGRIYKMGVYGRKLTTSEVAQLLANI